MKWIKKGLIYNRPATTPTPILLDPTTIRVYAGFLDAQGVSRIGYVDVDARDPKNIKRISKKPVLDIGKPGTFDDNGVILGDVICIKNIYYMYYVGFQIPQKVKFLAFTGLAVSRDGETFERVSDTPVFDRAPDEYYTRAIHTVMVEKKLWRVWYGTGNSWEIIKGRAYPKYSIKYTASKDGRHFHSTGIACIPLSRRNEYRIGRPRVYKTPTGYQMLYTRGFRDGRYVPGYAESADGIRWVRKDGELGLTLSPSGWDSQMLCYPSLVRYHHTTYAFYNGNGMGKTGFGYAILAPQEKS